MEESMGGSRGPEQPRLFKPDSEWSRMQLVADPGPMERLEVVKSSRLSELVSHFPDEKIKKIGRKVISKETGVAVGKELLFMAQGLPGVALPVRATKLGVTIHRQGAKRTNRKEYQAKKEKVTSPVEWMGMDIADTVEYYGKRLKELQGKAKEFLVSFKVKEILADEYRVETAAAIAAGTATFLAGEYLAGKMEFLPKGMDKRLKTLLVRRGIPFVALRAGILAGRCLRPEKYKPGEKVRERTERVIHTAALLSTAFTAADLIRGLSAKPEQGFVNDVDNDGLPDDWEIAHFDNLDVAGKTSDFDGDGISDLEEFRRGTDPIFPPPSVEAIPPEPQTVEMDLDNDEIPVFIGVDKDGDELVDEVRRVGPLVNWIDVDEDGQLSDGDLVQVGEFDRDGDDVPDSFYERIGDEKDGVKEFFTEDGRKVVARDWDGDGQPDEFKEVIEGQTKWRLDADGDDEVDDLVVEREGDLADGRPIAAVTPEGEEYELEGGGWTSVEAEAPSAEAPPEEEFQCQTILGPRGGLSGISAQEVHQMNPALNGFQVDWAADYAKDAVKLEFGARRLDWPPIAYKGDTFGSLLNRYGIESIGGKPIAELLEEAAKKAEGK